MPPKSKRNMPVVCTEEEMNFLCEWGTCETTLDTLDDLMKHVNEHLNVFYSILHNHNVSGGNFACMWQGCGVNVDGSEHDFTRHILFHVFHTKIKEMGRVVIAKNPNPVGDCALDESSRNLIPELPERLCCGWKHCDMAYDNAELFYRHVNQHADSYEGSCKLRCMCSWDGCNVLQTSRYRLKEHLRSHTQEKVIACPKCGALFSCRTKFLDHRRKQGLADGLRYQCSHCSKRFATERLLRDHMRHHVNNYKCTYCDMTSPTPSGLKSHMRYRHSNERPYTCDLCDHSSKSSTDLRKHVTMHHTDSVVYGCNVDGCDFNTKNYLSLTLHFRTHTEVKKYACHECDDKFVRGSSLTKHLKVSHKYKWPSGHRRFRYTMHGDGLLRLQTLRYESVQLVDGDHEQVDVVTEGVDLGEDYLQDENETPTPGESDDESYNLSMLVNTAVQQDIPQDAGPHSDAAITAIHQDIGHFAHTELATTVHQQLPDIGQYDGVHGATVMHFMGGEVAGQGDCVEVTGYSLDVEVTTQGDCLDQGQAGVILSNGGGDMCTILGQGQLGLIHNNAQESCVSISQGQMDENFGTDVLIDKTAYKVHPLERKGKKRPSKQSKSKLKGSKGQGQTGETLTEINTNNSGSKRIKLMH